MSPRSAPAARPPVILATACAMLEMFSPQQSVRTTGQRFVPAPYEPDYSAAWTTPDFAPASLGSHFTQVATNRPSISSLRPFQAKPFSRMTYRLLKDGENYSKARASFASPCLTKCLPLLVANGQHTTPKSKWRQVSLVVFDWDSIQESCLTSSSGGRHSIFMKTISHERHKAKIDNRANKRVQGTRHKVSGPLTPDVPNPSPSVSIRVHPWFASSPWRFHRLAVGFPRTQGGRHADG